MENAQVIKNRVVSGEMRGVAMWEEPSAMLQTLLGLAVGVLLVIFVEAAITSRMTSPAPMVVGTWWAGAVFAGPMFVLLLVSWMSGRKARARRWMLSQLCAILEVPPKSDQLEQRLEIALAYFAHILTDLGDAAPAFMRAQFAEARELVGLLYPHINMDKQRLVEKWALEGLLIMGIGHGTALRTLAKFLAETQKKSRAA